MTPDDDPRPTDAGQTWQRPSDGRAVYGLDEGAPAPSLDDPLEAPPAARPAPPAYAPPPQVAAFVGAPGVPPAAVPPPQAPPPAGPPMMAPPPSQQPYGQPPYGAPYPPPGYPPQPPAYAPYAYPPAMLPPAPPSSARSPKVRLALITGVVGVLAGFATNLLVCLLPIAMLAGAATVLLAMQAGAEARAQGREEELAPWLMLLGGVVLLVPMLLAALAFIMVLFFQDLMVKMLSGAGG